MMRAGAVASGGTTPASGATKRASAKQTATTTEVRPVRPPDATPAADSMYVVAEDTLAALGGAASVSSATTYIESAAGVASGGRTGLTSVVVAVCFALALFVAPLAGVVPPEATAPALIVVGY